ncbi:serine hydrolase domain-containing protein [Kineobactrum salinum]|uniref:Serine hydrolase n=1 Tax=Kineobactrum salinum TaxID=2708301 RepID=A0A6C0U058_9GAMM|nr:serine hydrolase [Kineobactrum salinum]QIB65298.1 serine hydrolase [Kineobactrum salinum]
MNHSPQPTTSNWGQAPHNRRSFQIMQELFPSCRLPRGPALGPEPAARPRDILDWEYHCTSGALRSVAELLDDTCCDAFLVLQGDELLAEHYFNGMRANSHHLVNSVTKTFVGMLTGIAVERGQLDPDRLVADYVPELGTPAWAGTTLRHLLDMSAGVRYEEEYNDPQTDFWREAAVVGWHPALVTASTPATLLDYARSLRGKAREDGSMFYYTSVATNVLGMALERAMGQPLSALLAAELWGRLGMRHDASIVVDRSGFPYVGAGMSACARDLLNFGRMLNSGGSLRGECIVPASWIDDTLRGDASSKQCFADGMYGPALPGWHYRNQMWVKDTEGGVMLSLGIHGQVIYMDRDRELVMVVLSSQPVAASVDTYMAVFGGLEAVAERLDNGG